MLELALLRLRHLRRARVAQHMQKKRQSIGQRLQVRSPAAQISQAGVSVAFLPSVICRQVKGAGAARYENAAANTHQPVIFRQLAAGFAVLALESGKSVFHITGKGFQRLLGDGRVAALGGQIGFVVFQIFQHISLDVDPAGHVHDFKQGDQRKMVIQGSRMG